MTARWSLARHVTLSPAEGGAVLLDARKRRYWQLNASGAQIVEYLQEGRSQQDAADALSEESGETVERAAADVAALVETLRSSRLIVKRK